MNIFIATSLVFSSLALGSTDFSHCQKAIQDASGRFFQMDEKGQITVRDLYKESDTEIIPANDESPQRLILKTGHSTVTAIIERDTDGGLKKFSVTEKVDPKTYETGLGKGIRVPGGGSYTSPYLGIVASNPTHTLTHEFKSQNGKCFPFRSYSKHVNNINAQTSIEGQMRSDIYLCRDIDEFIQKHQKELQNCFGKDSPLNQLARNVLESHKTRNKDLYAPEDKKGEQGPSTGGVFIANGLYPGGGGIGVGGYLGSNIGPRLLGIDDLVYSHTLPMKETKDPMFIPVMGIYKLKDYCEWHQGRAYQDVLQDASLWGTKAPAPAAETQVKPK